jgi:hypothetical protein
MLFVLILNLLPSNSHLDSSCSWKILCVGYVEIQWEVVEESARHTQVWRSRTTGRLAGIGAA